MLVFRSAAIAMALALLPASGFAQGGRPVPAEHQEMVEKRAKERERINDCQKQATEHKILPRDRTQFVISCLEK
jgi:hypothetical protein